MRMSSTCGRAPASGEGRPAAPGITALGTMGGGGSGHRGVARGGGDGHRGDGGIEGAAPTPFLAGMAENGGRGSRVVVGGGEPR
jgi:hypothetical protein